ncbi:MAG: threonine--tRNA ligase [Clostridia bacterium]|nr:threonine--tRNA ligase [Clostridia bacterium]
MIKVLYSDGKVEEKEYNEAIKVVRHTASHVLAQAVKKVYPEAKLAIGPATDEGFYYDFDNLSIAEQDLRKLENIMRNIISQNQEMKVYEVPIDEAKKMMEDEPYKLELIEEMDENAHITMYENGPFVDMCAGPHLTNTKDVGAIKLMSTTGAYWRGSEKNKMLTRIYGVCFETEKEVEEYIEKQEDAKRRDHNKLGREMEYFTTVDYIGQGLPILLPKGAKVIQLLQRFVEDTEAKRGWQLTKTPFMAKSDLYKISGHWDHYKDGMFVLGDEEKDDEVFALRPMTCPFQYQVFLNRGRSYRDLPMRLNETSTLFRNEASGEMHGLIRVRQFTISEGHLMCTPEQLEQEFKSCLELAIYMLKCLGLYEDVSYRFSKWDPDNREKYIGTEEQWDEAQNMMEKILNHLGIEYKVGIGEAAFYGPKLDIQIKNVFGKEDTLITIQIDQMLAEKFGMKYVDRDGEKKAPYIIHRTSIGCYERTLALILEKYAGALPLWIAPTQIKLLTLNDDMLNFANEVKAKLEQAGIRVELDSSNEKIGYKIRNTKLEKVPYFAVIGAKEKESGELAIKNRADEEFKLSVEELIEKIQKECSDAVNSELL